MLRKRFKGLYMYILKSSKGKCDVASHEMDRVGSLGPVVHMLFKSIRPMRITNRTASLSGLSRSVCEKRFISLFGPVA